MRILVLGHRGMLGSDLTEVLGRDHEVNGVDIGEFDMTSEADCIRVVEEFKPGVVVNAAAYTDVDGCETNRDACFAVNAEGVRNIACACRASRTKIIHYSTDYVFDGTKGEPYVEDDPCRPINVYGESKRKGEEFLVELAENHLLIRTAWLYGRQGKNFVKAILAKARDEGKLRVVDDQVGSPTYSVDLAQATKLLVERDSRGTYHVTNRGVCSWYQFALRILEYAQVSGVTVEPIRSDELIRKAKRPAYSVMSNRKFMEATQRAMRPWQVALNDYLNAQSHNHR
ncbi:MAG TPA: dTDP-4-dehydrorhamnose reductase [Syntrophales bacterium]|nr:dTDP-4-dehydrorhamnose reductase [Syntrophales bacterium]